MLRMSHGVDTAVEDALGEMSQLLQARGQKSPALSHLCDILG